MLSALRSHVIMLRNLVIEALGVFLWVYTSLSIHRTNRDAKLENQLALGQALVDFFVMASFYVIGSKISGAHLNPIISFGHFLIAEITLAEVT